MKRAERHFWLFMLLLTAGSAVYSLCHYGTLEAAIVGAISMMAFPSIFYLMAAVKETFLPNPEYYKCPHCGKSVETAAD